MSAEDQVSDARRVRLDPDRQAVARQRAETALMIAEYHDGRAAAERAKAGALVQTWGLCPFIDLAPEDEATTCCRDIIKCARLREGFPPA